MFDRNCHATHPDMMQCVSNDELRDRSLVQNLFREGDAVLSSDYVQGHILAVDGGWLAR